MDHRSHGFERQSPGHPPRTNQGIPGRDGLQLGSAAPGGVHVGVGMNQVDSNVNGESVIDISALWGYLQPCTEALPRINLFKEILRYSVGRDGGNNYITLNGGKVSFLHCVLTWDPATSSVTVLDMSTNGTWLDGEKVGRGNTLPLTDGTEIGFGSAIAQPDDGEIRDFRYVFHYTANGPPTQGIKAYFDFGVQLGRGASGVVHLATSRNTGQLVAVKRILKRVTEGRDHDDGMDEVGTMKKLEHPNICKLLQVFDAGSHIFLVLEYIDGGDLIKLMRNQYTKGVPEIVAKDILYQACDAMAFVHSKGIVHRDLKLENILLTNDPHPIVKIADFGLAAALDGVTLLRRQCGTPSYIAPEMNDLHDEEGYDHMVDSWSMGVIAFSMLAGGLPFQNQTCASASETIHKRFVDWDLLTSQYGLYPESILFVRALLEKDPRRRLALSDALGHPWMRDHIPYHVNIATVFKPSDTNRPLTAVAAYRLKLSKAMSAAARAKTNAQPRGQRPGGPYGIAAMDSRQQVAHLLLNRGTHDSLGFDRNTESFFSQLKPTAFSPPPAPPDDAPSSFASHSVSPAPSAGARPLVRRRSEVIAEAAESGTPLPEPSQEMIANAERMTRTAKGKGRAIEAALSAIPEAVESEEIEDVHMASPEKKGRNEANVTNRGIARHSAYRQEGPSRWAGAIRFDSPIGANEAEEEDDLDMGGASPVRRPRPGSSRAMKRKDQAVAARKVRHSRGSFVRQLSSDAERGMGSGKVRKGRGRKQI